MELWDRQAAAAPSVVARVLAAGQRGNTTSVKSEESKTVELLKQNSTYLNKLG